MRKNTNFKQKVYETVKQIPKGKVSTYSTIAQDIGYPRAWRAVGNILNKNRNPNVFCHRVIRSDGKIGGYGQGTKKKINILRREGIIIKRGRIAQ